MQVTLSGMPPLDSKQCTRHDLPDVPAGLKLVAKQVKVGSEDEATPQFCCSFGVYRTPLLWIDNSLSVVHPFDCFHAVPDDMMRVIFTLMTQEPSQIAQERAATLKQWTQWARELAADEKKLFAQLDAGVANVLKGKRLLRLERIANSIGWPDTRLFAEMRAGFMIVGMQEPSGIFGLEPRPASYSVDELCSASKFLRPALLGKVRSAEDSDVAKELWRITLDEATNKEWMVGPLDVDEVRARHGEHWIPARRFGIRQSSGDKLRPLDDYAENRVNGAYA